MSKNKEDLTNPDNEESTNLTKVSKLKKLKNSKSYKKLAASATALMLAHTIQSGGVAIANKDNFRHNHSGQKQYKEPYQNTQKSNLFWLIDVRFIEWSVDNNQRWEWIDPNKENPDKERQLDNLNRAINNAIAHINNTSNHRERQQYIDELNQLLQARDVLQGSNSGNNNYSGHYNDYEYNDRFSTIRTSFGSNSNYWSNNPDKRERMKDLERNQVSYRFRDTKHTKEKFDKLTALYQVDENGRRVWSFDKMLSNGESVLLKFVFKHRSETVQVSYRDRVLKIRPIDSRRTKEIYITRDKLKRRWWTHKIAFWKWANKDGDGYRMVLWVSIEN